METRLHTPQEEVKTLPPKRFEKLIANKYTRVAAAALALSGLTACGVRPVEISEEVTIVSKSHEDERIWTGFSQKWIGKKTFNYRAKRIHR